MHLRYMADTFKQVTIHKKYMVSGEIGPIFGGKVALTQLDVISQVLGAMYGTQSVGTPL